MHEHLSCAGTQEGSTLKIAKPSMNPRSRVAGFSFSFDSSLPLEHSIRAARNARDGCWHRAYRLRCAEEV